MINQTWNKKVNLSARMRRIVDILKRETDTEGKIPCLLDIGCDHAFISISCIQESIAEHVIAMDVKSGPLAIADSNIQAFGLEKSVETRLSDGFEQAKPGEASWAVIAGMGGALMCRILQEGHAHLEHGIGLVLQPQSELDVVRLYLARESYRITDEAFLQEDGKFYTIIKAKKDDVCMELDETDALYGPILTRQNNALYGCYLRQEQKKREELLLKLSDSDTESATKRCEAVRHELAVLRDAERRMEHALQ